MSDEDHRSDTRPDVDETTAIEQWKFYASTTQEVSNRRLKNNRFYLRLLVALLGIAGIGNRLSFVTASEITAIGVIGFILCVLWAFHILSYKQLNRGKYSVLVEIADELSFNPFHMEWDELQEGKDPSVYIKHTTVEIWWPRVLGYFFLLLAVFGATSVIDNIGLFFIFSTIVTLLWIAYVIIVLCGISPVRRYWEYNSN